MISTLQPEGEGLSLVKHLGSACGRLWNFDLLGALFGKDDQKAISMIPIGGAGQEDKLIWHHSFKGIYKVKMITC